MIHKKCQKTNSKTVKCDVKCQLFVDVMQTHHENTIAKNQQITTKYDNCAHTTTAIDSHRHTNSTRRVPQDNFSATNHKECVHLYQNTHMLPFCCVRNYSQ